MIREVESRVSCCGNARIRQIIYLLETGAEKGNRRSPTFSNVHGCAVGITYVVALCMRHVYGSQHALINSRSDCLILNTILIYINLHGVTGKSFLHTFFVSFRVISSSKTILLWWKSNPPHWHHSR